MNLFLEVLGRRPDGYHEVATLLLAIDLFDELDFRPAPTGDLSLTCDVPELLTGPENLVLKAARRLRETTGYAGYFALTAAFALPAFAFLSGAARWMEPRPEAPER